MTVKSFDMIKFAKSLKCRMVFHFCRQYSFFFTFSFKDIPLETQGSSSSTARYNLVCGRILNVAHEYDPKCEKHLTHAIKMEPSLGEAWYELGECLWKKKDYESATDCFKVFKRNKIKKYWFKAKGLK